MRSAALLTGLVAFAGLLALVVVAVVSDRSQAFTIGVQSASPLQLAPGDEVCQSPIGVPSHADFDGVRFALGTNKRPRPAIHVTVRDSDTKAVPLARHAACRLLGRRPHAPHGLGRARGRPADRQRLPRRRGPPRRFRLRLRRRRIAADVGAPRRQAHLVRRQPQLRAPAPGVPGRACARDRGPGRAFRAGGVGTGTYVLLAVLVLGAVPLLVMRAVATAECGDT